MQKYLDFVLIFKRKFDKINLLILFWSFKIMKALEEKILKDGHVAIGNILKVDSFLNHQIDVKFMNEIGKEFKRLYKDEKIDKILTIEASGIGIACIAAQYFDVPVVFAKKTKTKNIYGDVYTSKVESFTHGTTYDIILSKEFLHEGERILIIDDFLAKGNALIGLINLVRDAKAEVVGAGIVIEKAFQEGGKIIRDDYGIRCESLARIKSMSYEDGIEFTD